MHRFASVVISSSSKLPFPHPPAHQEDGLVRWVQPEPLAPTRVSVVKPAEGLVTGTAEDVAAVRECLSKTNRIFGRG